MNTLLSVARWGGRIVVLTLLGAALGYQTAAALSHAVSIPAALAGGSIAGLIVFAASMVLLVRLNRRRWVLDVVHAMLAAVLLGWMAWDPPSSASAQSLAPTISIEAEPSRAAIAKLFKGGESDRWAPIFEANSSLGALSLRRDEPDAYLEAVRTAAAEIESAWENAGEPRAWLDEINGFDPISDFATRFDSPVLSFSRLRALTRLHCHRATLLALDGRGDEALDTLQPLARFSGRLRRGGRTLVSVMIAIVLEGNLIDTTRLVVSRSACSPQARERLAAVLDDGVWDGRDLARAFRAEHDMVAAQIGNYTSAQIVDLMAFGSEPPVIARWIGRCGSAVLFQPNHFCREHRVLMERIARCAEQLDGAGMAAAEAEIETRFTRLPTTNPAGGLLMQMVVPALSKVEKNSRERLQQRRELVAELRS